MVNFYYGLKADPHTFRQFSCRELLFLNYDCPVKDKRYDIVVRVQLLFLRPVPQKSLVHSRQDLGAIEAGHTVGKTVANFVVSRMQFQRRAGGSKSY